MKRHYMLTALLIAGLFCLSEGFAAISVVSIQGSAAFKDKDQWKPLREKQTLAEGARISTGVRSSVVLSIDETMVTVKQMSMVRVNKNLTTQDESATNLGLKYGSVSARVSRIKKLRTVFNVSTPVATSSVRGTWEDVSYGPGSGMKITVYEGTVGAENKSGVNNLVRKGMKFQIKSGSARPGSLLSAFRSGSLGSINPDALTEEEKNMLDQYGDDIHLNFDDSPYSAFPRGNAVINLEIVFPK